ncbi:BZ3500_MvSof-1268-A1-R1_Chr4-1g06657 [Microbotryum saponariae]|uniref:BZ3500_MvSof-1268-A1-R1_Chr4-1g06657 protein n=1 Tax=Microbotryum saponariae TaxID=289078 RepID=A0A2X0MVN4_9BASI|nr:BZ3500_MvSof-1268-A1-R1_Chr4-1g06657 [Microbotryum saponariae]SDA06322.1 BZ3501_MvSof-1269-A2-R1_Chr4-1g06367 [Microbotryum saponariae]
MPRISSNSGGRSTRFRCRCFLHACDLKRGGRAIARSTIHNHRKEDVEYYEGLLRRGAPVPHELERAIAWSKTRPEPIDLFKKTQPAGQPEPNAAPNVEALPQRERVVSTSKPEDREFEERQDKKPTSRMEIILSATHDELLHNPVYHNVEVDLCNAYRRLNEQLMTRIPAANRDTSSSGSNPPRQTQEQPPTTLLSHVQRPAAKRPSRL